MWIERLDLLRIGPFRERSISLPGPGAVAVIYGPNEAGKSTALRAIERLLYGFELRDGGLAHGFAQRLLQVGGRLAEPSGAALEAVRRKGQGETLSDPDDQPIPEETLSALLGGVGQAQFRALYGLDQERLRAEGHALLQSGGAFGRSLLSAGAALGAARELRTRFAERAEALASLRPSKKPFNLALERRNEATKRLREASLGREAWRAAQDGAEAADAALAQSKDALRAAQIAQERAARAAAAAPALARLEALLVETAAFADLPEGAAEPGAGQGRPAAAPLREAGGRWESARETRAAAEDRLAQARLALEASPPPSPALGQAEAIDALGGPLAAVRAARTEAAARGRRRDAARAKLDAVATGCGISVATLAAEAARRAPSRAETAAIEAQLETGRRIEAEIAAADRACADAAEATAGRPPVAAETVERLRELWPIAQAAAERRDAADQATDAATAADGAARDAAAALIGPAQSAADGAALAAQRVPDAAEIAAFEQRFAQAEADAAARRARAEDLDARLDKAQAAAADRAGASLDDLSAESLAAARSARDALLGDLRGESLDGAARRAAFDHYQTRVVATDGLADRRFDRAAQLERRAAADAEIAQLRADQTALRAAEAAAAEAGRAMAADWAACWPDLGAPPKTPEAMRRWLGARAAAIAQAETARSAAARADKAQAAAAEAEAALIAIADGLGFTRKARAPGETASPEALRAGAARLEAALEAARRRLSAETARSAAAGRRAAWRQAYAPIADRLGAPTDGPVDAGAAALAAWTAAPEALAQAAEIDAEADRAAAAEAALREAVGRLGPPPTGTAAEDSAQAAERWAEALAQDRAQAEALAARREAADALRREAKTAAAAEARAAQRLSERLAAATGAAAPTDPARAAAAAAALAARLEARDALWADIRAARSALLAAGRGADEDALRAEIAAFAAAGFEGPALEAEAAARETARRAAEEALGQAAGDARAAAEALDRLRARSEAAAEAQARADAIAQMRLIAEQWGAATAATALLDAAAERYRSRVGDPLLDRAAGHFERLTCGAFTGLSVSGGSTERLQARRRDPAADPIGVDEMSEGARDQLFLALRLAAIELRAEAGPTPPFVGDDIFASFDDARAAAGLETLAALAERTQTILFTHHSRLAEIAQTRLGGRAAVIELGPGGAGGGLRAAV